MKKYIGYFKYVFRHKYFVMQECFKYGLYWRGLTHDLSKFLPSEFIPYANYFYGKVSEQTAQTHEDFYFAWLSHIKRNPHHWQNWILRLDSGEQKIFKMKPEYLMEMICDWIGAGKAQGKVSPKDDPLLETRNFYYKNRDKILLHKETRDELEIFLKIMD